MMNIRNFKKIDLSKIGFLQPEGWEDITFHFKFFEKVSFCFPVVAEIDNKISGVTNCLVNKNTGWISHIIVSEKKRKKGIGCKLTKHVMHILSENNCSSQFLIATKMGETLYENLGFKKSTLYNFYIGQQLNFCKNENIRKLNKSDYSKIFELDFSVSGEHREHMIKHFIANGYVYEDKFSHDIIGYYLPDLGDGVVIALDINIGLELLKLKHSIAKYMTVLPEENIAGNDFLNQQGFKLHNHAYRMVFGKEVNWKPKSVFCRIGGYYA